MPLDKQTSELAKELVTFIQNKYGFDRMPKIRFVGNKQNASNILGMTGGYDPKGESITVYVTDRHPKDVLRSLAHELMHHVQKCEGAMGDHDMSVTQDKNYILHDDFLKQIEADAFERGNITFREWEASKKGGKTMSETKHKGQELKAFKKKRHDIAHAMHKQDPSMPMAKKMRIATDAAEKSLKKNKKKKQEEGVEESARSGFTPEQTPEEWEEGQMHENKEVQVNQALKDSHTYVPQDRALADAYNSRDERVYNELLKKFGIKK